MTLIASLALISVLAEITVFMLLMPIHGDSRVPPRIKAAMILFLSALIFSGRYESLSRDHCTLISPLEVFIISLSLGLVMGLSFRVAIIASTILGSIISQTGSFSQIFSPTVTDDVSTALGSFATVSVLFVLASSDVHMLLIDALLQNKFECIALAEAADTFLLYIGYFVREAMAVIFQLSYPFLLVSLLYFACVGVIGRAMPQFMVMLVGTPVIQLISIGLLVLFIEPITTRLIEAFGAGARNP